RPSRPRCGDLRRIPAPGRHRLVTAPDEGRGPARIRAHVAPDRESLDRGTRRTAADDEPRGARDYGRPHRGPGASYADRPGSPLPRRLPDGDPQPGVWQQRRIMLCLRLARRAPKGALREFPGRVQLWEARPGPG